MFKTVAITAIVASLAVPAFAGNPNSAGALQLSAQAGVTPGIYDASQLSRLIDAQRDSNLETVNFILSQGADLDTNTLDGASVNAGKAQLAAEAGVDASDFTIAQLERLIQADRDNDDEEVRFILSQAGTYSDNGVVSTSSVPSAGHKMLAATLGVDANDYTVNELQRLDKAVQDNDQVEIRFRTK